MFKDILRSAVLFVLPVLLAVIALGIWTYYTSDPAARDAVQDTGAPSAIENTDEAAPTFLERLRDSLNPQEQD